MGKKDPRVDEYIAKSRSFAQPILRHLRKIVHTACPQVEETIKWGSPHFDYKVKALKKHKRALVAFESFSPSHRREYVEWISEAKTGATRDKRLATAVEWIAEGKPRNWKYMR